jgi:predicted cupin superfamily sugar epimerase
MQGSIFKSKSVALPRSISVMSTPLAHWIDHLGLQPHPEGGYYREIYRSARQISPELGLERAAATHIYYLLGQGDRSCFHRIRWDELWHLYAGEGLVVHLLDPQKGYKALRLTADQPFGWVPAGVWFGATVKWGSSFALAGCTVAPGFEFADFEMADRQELLEQFPQQQALIQKLTPEP